MRAGRAAASIVTALVSATVVIGLRPLIASAAGAVHGSWTVAGANPSWSGALTVPSTGFPEATLATNSNTPLTPTAAFLNAATPFGTKFGSTQGTNYLSASAAAGRQPSTTTITFAQPTPASGWGFALGDVDDAQIQIQASGPAGPAPISSLGFQDTFNYCTITTPRPASCAGTSHNDVPTWDPTTGTLVATGGNTAGASAWFLPDAPITSITLTYTVLTTISSFQLWAAAATSNISGSVTLNTGAPAPPGTTVRLIDSSGISIATAAPVADGTYSFANVVAAVDTVEVVPPAGFEVVGDARRPADANTGDVSGLDFVLTAIPPSTTTTSTSVTQPPTSPPPAEPGPPTTNAPAAPSSTSSAGLPATGSSTRRVTLPAAIAGLLGLVLVVVARRRAGSPTS